MSEVTQKKKITAKYLSSFLTSLNINQKIPSPVKALQQQTYCTHYFLWSMELPLLLFYLLQNNCITVSHTCLHVFRSILSTLLPPPHIPPLLTHSLAGSLHFSSKLICSVSTHCFLYELPKNKNTKVFSLPTFSLALFHLSVTHTLYKVYSLPQNVNGNHGKIIYWVIKGK